MHRGLDMADAARVFMGKCLTFPDMRRDYDEKRLVTIGYLEGRMVVLVWTWRGKSVRRIISMRKANEREQAIYANQLG
jgi:uncharacterized DUF497 family protein